MFKIIISLLVSITIISVESGIAEQNTCSGIGQVCGGHRVDMKTCCEGLVCGPIEDLAVDKPGTCGVENSNKCSGVGEVCGGFVLHPKSCCDGLDCGPKEDLARDIPGKCHQKAL